MEETDDSLLEETDGDSLLGNDESALEDTSNAFAALESSDASGDASVCTGDDEKDALDTEARAGTGKGGEPAVADDHVRVAVEGVAKEECQEGEELVQKGMHLLQGIQIQTNGGLAGGAEQD